MKKQGNNKQKIEFQRGKIESQKRNDRNDEMKDNENNGNNEIKGNNRSRL